MRTAPLASLPAGPLAALRRTAPFLAALVLAATTLAVPSPVHAARGAPLRAGAFAPDLPEPRPLEIDDLFRLARVGAPTVSPDGRWIAYTVSTTSLEEGRSETRVWMSAADGSEHLPMTREGTSAGSPAWSPDGRYLTFTAARNGDATQVWALDRRGGEAFPLTDVDQGIRDYAWSPDGSRLLLTIRDPGEEAEATADDPGGEAPGAASGGRGEIPEPWVVNRLQVKRDGVGYLTGDRRTHLYVLHLASGELRQLTAGPWDEGSAVWSPDGTRVAFVSNRTEDPDANVDSDLWVVDADRATPTDDPLRVTDQPGSDRAPSWSPDGRFLAYVTTPDVDAIWYATNHLAVVEVPMGEDRPSPPSIHEPRILTRSLDRNVRSPRWSEDGAWIWFGLEDSAEDHLARIRPDGTGLERPVSGALSAFGFDAAGGTVALQVNQLDRPAEIFVADGLALEAPAGSAARGVGHAASTEAALRRVTRHNDAWLADVTLGETRNVHFSSADGTEIEGFVTFPPGRAPDQGGPAAADGTLPPVLLRIHGGPVSQYRHSFNFEAQLFAAHGYVVVYTNPRGSSGYGQAFSEAIFADWGQKDFQDVMAGVDFVLDQGWGDPDRLGVGGWSYGGILTNYVITQTDRFEGAITGASEVLYIANYGHDHYQYWWEKELGLPWEGDNRATWERISPFNRAHLVTTPTLVMGGEKDWNVPIQNSEQLYQVLRRVGTPTELVVYPGQSHGIRVPSYQKDRYERYLAWYDRWVKEAAERPVS